jgi:DNA repair exonuclease SbcCD ATPase subunit
MKIKHIFFMKIILLSFQIHSSLSRPDSQRDGPLGRLAMVQQLRALTESFSDKNESLDTQLKIATVRQELLDRLSSADRVLIEFRDESKALHDDTRSKFTALQEQVDFRLRQLTQDALRQSEQTDQRLRDQAQKFEEELKKNRDENLARYKGFEKRLAILEGILENQNKVMQIATERFDFCSTRQQTDSLQLQKLAKIFEELEKNQAKLKRNFEELERRISLERSFGFSATFQSFCSLVRNLEERVEQIEGARGGGLSSHGSTSKNSPTSTRTTTPVNV